MNKPLKIQLNSTHNLRDVLQEAYNLANEQIIQAQNEINKLSVATQLQEETIEGKAKYAKAINDYLGIKDKAISKKLEIAKILSDVKAHSGDGKLALSDNTNIDSTFNFDDIRQMVDSSLEAKEKTKTIELHKK